MRPIYKHNQEGALHDMLLESAKNHVANTGFSGSAEAKRALAAAHAQNIQTTSAIMSDHIKIDQVPGGGDIVKQCVGMEGSPVLTAVKAHKAMLNKNSDHEVRMAIAGR